MPTECERSVHIANIKQQQQLQEAVEAQVAQGQTQQADELLQQQQEQEQLLDTAQKDILLNDKMEAEKLALGDVLMTTSQTSTASSSSSSTSTAATTTTGTNGHNGSTTAVACSNISASGSNSGSGNNINGAGKKTSITSPDPTAYVAKARVTRPTPPPPSYNPMQFVQIKPCNLYQTAQQQLKKAEEVKKIKEIKKEEPEDWQNNLDNWKSSRRKRVEHIIDRVVEVKKLELEEHDRSRRKSKTFSEMIEERGERERGVRTGRAKLASLAVYNEDEINDLSDLGIGTSSASGKSSLSEDYDNNSVMSDNAELDKAIFENNHKPNSTTREYISSPGYDTSSSTAPASSPDPCEYTYEGAIQDYKQRVSRATTAAMAAANYKLNNSNNNNGNSSIGNNSNSNNNNNIKTSATTSKESTPESGIGSGITTANVTSSDVYPTRRGSKIEDRLMGFEVTSPSDNQEGAEKSKVDVPKIDISKRKELFEKQNSNNEPKSVSSIGNNAVPKVTLRDRFKLDDSVASGGNSEAQESVKKEVKRLSGDVTSIRDRLQSLEQQQHLVNSTSNGGAMKSASAKTVDIPVPPLKDRLSSLQNAATKEEVKKPPVVLVDARQLEIMKHEEESAKLRMKRIEEQSAVASSDDVPTTVLMHIEEQLIKNEADEDAVHVDPDDSGIHTADDIETETEEQQQRVVELLQKEQEQQLNAAIAALALEEQQLEAAANAVNQIEAEFAELTSPATLNGSSTTNSAVAATNEQPCEMEFSINEALELALEAIDKETKVFNIEQQKQHKQEQQQQQQQQFNEMLDDTQKDDTMPNKTDEEKELKSKKIFTQLSNHNNNNNNNINNSNNDKTATAKSIKLADTPKQQQQQQTQLFIQQEKLQNEQQQQQQQKQQEEEVKISQEPIYENISAHTTTMTTASSATSTTLPVDADLKIIPNINKSNNNNNNNYHNHKINNNNINNNANANANNNNNNLVEITNAFAKQTNDIITTTTTTKITTTTNNNNKNNTNNNNNEKTFKTTTTKTATNTTKTTTTTPNLVMSNEQQQQQQQQQQQTPQPQTNSGNNSIVETAGIDNEPYYQVPKSSEPYYDEPKHLRPVPLYENIEIFYNGLENSSVAPHSTAVPNFKMEPPKEKPPPPPTESPPPFDDSESLDNNTDTWSSDNTYETISTRRLPLQNGSSIAALAMDHPSPPIKRMNSTKRIKKELRNKRSSFLGIEGSSLDDEETYLELTVAPPPDMAQLLQEERRLEKQLYMKAGLCDSSDTGESRDSGVSENHSRQSSEHYTNSSEENDRHSESPPRSLKPNEIIYQNEALLTAVQTPLLQTVKGNSAESWTESATAAAAATKSLTEATATANAKMLSIEEKIREQEEVLRVERELLQLEQEELKRQRENLMLRENMARRELQHGAKMLMSANRRSLQDLNVGAINGNVVSAFQPTMAQHATQITQQQPQQQIYANVPNIPQHYYQVETDYRKSMSDLNEFSKRLMLPPTPPTKPMRAVHVTTNGHQDDFALRQQRHSLNTANYGGSLVKIATPAPTAAPRGHIYSNYHHQSAQNLSNINGNAANTALSNGHAHLGNMSRNTLHALSATPKPKYTDGWVQVQNHKSYESNFVNDPAWLSAYQQKRKSMPEPYHAYNNHWLVQEAEQRRVAEQQQQQRRSISNGNTPIHQPLQQQQNGVVGKNISASSNSNGKPLPDSIIQTLTERVQSKGIGERKRFDNFSSNNVNANKEKSPLHAAAAYNHHHLHAHAHVHAAQLQQQQQQQQQQYLQANNNANRHHINDLNANNMNHTMSPQCSNTVTATSQTTNAASAASTTTITTTNNSLAQDKILSVSGKKKCSHCGDELGRGAAMIIESLLLFYHINCFKCCVCHVQLGDGLNGTDVRVRNHKLHCQNCYSSDDGIKFSCV